MRWFGGRESENIEDRRGIGPGHIVGGGIGTIIIGIIIYLLGGNPSDVVQQPAQSQYQYQSQASEDSMRHFVGVVLAQTEDVWTNLFEKVGREYEKPKLTLFTGAVQSACGNASAAVGPFYCPLDAHVYLDMSFFNELKGRFHASGDFANAYVIAHEIGHHVQSLLGTSKKVRRLQENSDERGSNHLSVMLELQADFYAGIWAHYMQLRGNVIESGDIEAALNAANAIGDDRLQKQARGYVVPDAFTHGTSQQRMYWFKRGFETGDLSKGNTFREMQEAMIPAGSRKEVILK